MTDVPTGVNLQNNTNVLTDISLANRDGYDAWAKMYDSYVNATVAMDDRVFPPLWRDLTGLDVLEVGCGTGRHTGRLAQQGNRVMGLDLSPGMLAIAREKLKASANVRLIEADIMSDGIEGPFDAALSALVIEHIADLPRFFARVAAALKPGAALFLSNIHPDKAAAGSGARFVDPQTGEERWLVNFTHTGAAIVEAAGMAGLACVLEQDALGDQALVDQRYEWARYMGKPMIRMWIFKKT
jgi:malonyl-CoA O-methyltransferase